LRATDLSEAVVSAHGFNFNTDPRSCVDSFFAGRDSWLRGVSFAYTESAFMGQQRRKVVKRRRRTAYLERKKTKAKQAAAPRREAAAKGRAKKQPAAAAPAAAPASE
jgi:hypothetical protein